MDGGAEVAAVVLLRLACVEADPRCGGNVPHERPGPRLELSSPGPGPVRSVEGHSVGVADAGEHVATVAAGQLVDAVVVTNHRLRHGLPVGCPGSRSALDVDDREGHRPGGERARTRRTSRPGVGAELWVVAEDPQVHLLQGWAGLDAQRVTEAVSSDPVRGQRVGLASDPVERCHEQPPEAFTQGVSRGQLRELGDRARGV